MSRLSFKLLTLALGGLLTTVVITLVLAYILWAWWNKPIFGFGAEGPDQPIAFTHNVHVEAGIQCEFCHRNVSIGDAATLPAVEQCLFCHKTVVGEDVDGVPNLEIIKLLEYGGLNPMGQEDPSLIARPIDWERVHRLPDHVQFTHEAHIRYFTQGGGQELAIEKARDQGLPLSDPPRASELLEATCAICHGKVRAMEKVKQERSLKMGDCVDCHRDNDAPTDCVTCHY